MFLRPLILVLAAILTAAAAPRLVLPRNSDATRKAQEALYMPSGRALRAVSFGYRNVAAHILWFQTIMYFGRHVNRDRDYTWLSHMCDLVTNLNPLMRQVYEFGGVIMAWEVKQPQLGVDLLSRGIERFPNYWRLYFLRGILRFHFLHDDLGAQQDFQTGAKLPDAIPQLIAMAAKKITKTSGAEMTIQFLNDTLNSTTDPAARTVIERSLNDARYDRDRIIFAAAVDQYQQRYGRDPTTPQELVTTGIINRLPQEPYGGRYIWNSETRGVEGDSEDAGKRLPLARILSRPQSAKALP